MLWETEASGLLAFTLRGLSGSSGLDLPGLNDPEIGGVGDLEVGASSTEPLRSLTVGALR